jgi:hypothetical protein
MTSQEEPSSKPCPAWTLETALQFIREAGPTFDAIQACPALAGGVLLRGSSEKDLDIQVIPRKDTKLIVNADLIAILEIRLALRFERSRQWSPCVMLLKFSRPSTGHEIDFFFATPHVALGNAPAPPRLEPIETRPYIDPKVNRPSRGHPM